MNHTYYDGELLVFDDFNEDVPAIHLWKNAEGRIVFTVREGCLIKNTGIMSELFNHELRQKDDRVEEPTTKDKGRKTEGGEKMGESHKEDYEDY